MRILVTTPPGLGHVNPMLPLSAALQRRGHEVTWAAGASACEVVRAAGMTAVVAGPPGPQGARFWELNPELRSLPPQEIPDHMFPKMFGGIVAPAMLEDLVPFAESWEPELVISDAAALAGPIVAAKAGVANVTKGYGALIPEHRVAAASDVVAPLWRSVGLEPRPYAGLYDHLYLDVYPPGLQGPLPAYVGRHFGLGPAADRDTSETDPDVARFLTGGGDGRPLVYLTLGTAFNDPAVLVTAVAALSSLPVRVLVTVGPASDPTAIGDQPANVRVERYVPQAAVLDHAAMVVSHAGSGAVLGTLAQGLPQICLPQGADQFMNAEAVAKAGAGLALPPAEATAGAIAGAAARVLNEGAFAASARAIAAVIAAMPSPDEVAEMLEQL